VQRDVRAPPRATASKQKDEDAIALEKYAKADDNKIKQLSLQVERMNGQLAQLQVCQDTHARGNISRPSDARGGERSGAR